MRRGLRWWLALPAATLGGLALDAATPWLEWWPMGFIGAALIIASVWQQRLGLGLLAGLVAGCAFWLPQISWLTLYLGPIPWLALSAVMVLWFTLFGGAAALATRALHRVWLQAPAVAGLWVAREQVQSTWPYGGFAWGRVAHTQAESPFVALVSWTGVAGFSGLIALGCALVVGALFNRRRPPGASASSGSTNPEGRTVPRRFPIAVPVVIALFAALAFVPVAPQTETGTLRIAAVQGNSKSGIFDDRENGDVIRNHLEATEALLEELEATGERVDLIVWPENSAEFQLPDQHFRSLAVQRLAKRAAAPILVGTILQNTDGTFTNSSLVFGGEGDAGLRYDKRRPVPFAEYMPNRDFFHAIVPELVDLVQLDYAFGTRPAVLPIDTPAGRIDAGIAICFDIIFDDHAVAMAHDDAQIILAQTNNADFGPTDESAQQLQIARLRAVESGRTLVNISTVGTSAIVGSDGRDLATLTPFTADAMVAEVPLYEGSTPALHYGALITAAWITVGLAGLAAGVISLLRRSRGAREAA